MTPTLLEWRPFQQRLPYAVRDDGAVFSFKSKRLLRGEKHPWAKLSDVDVEAIRRERRENNALYRELAAKYGTSVPHVCDIVRGRKRVAA